MNNILFESEMGMELVGIYDRLIKLSELIGIIGDRFEEINKRLDKLEDAKDVSEVNSCSSFINDNK